jgi:hypothetical protein
MAFEMSRKMGQKISSSSKQNIALSCDEDKKIKRLNQAQVQVREKMRRRNIILR